jgi:hypothetical protein
MRQQGVDCSAAPLGMLSFSELAATTMQTGIASVTLHPQKGMFREEGFTISPKIAKTHVVRVELDFHVLWFLIHHFVLEIFF